MNAIPPLYKYLSLDGAQIPSWQQRVGALLQGRCYLSSAADFNDPFDCLPHILPPAADKLAAWAVAMGKRMATLFEGAAPAEFIERDVQSKIGDLPLPTLAAKLQEAAANTARSMGVFCLAETIDSVLMWSHYASNHRGIALRFDPMRVAENGGLGWMWKVSYQDARPVVADVHAAEQTTPLADALATKASFWSYEREWRVMKPDRAGETIPFDARMISGIVLGARCRPADEEVIRLMLADREVEMFRVVADTTSFDLSIVAA